MSDSQSVVPELSPVLGIAVVGIIVVAGAVNGLAGFGFALVGTMALATAINPTQAVVFMIIPILAVNLSLVGELSGSELLVALGRRPNTDQLNTAAAGIETDDRGFITTDNQLRTSAENVWAQGDIADNAVFKHSGDYETQVTIENVVHEGERTAEFDAMPHAIFTEPQMAGVGATEQELRENGADYIIGKQFLPQTPMGRAKKLEHGFVKVLASPAGDILGCHILGYEASTMIHEVVVAMRSADGTVEAVTDVIHAHPALNKAVQYAFEDI